VVPKILNLENPIDEPKINYAMKTESQNMKYALKNAFGFGGVNVSLLFRKWEK
jgi:3-oxoacyl-[acyl-carrier-protein] synthase II